MRVRSWIPIWQMVYIENCSYCYSKCSLSVLPNLVITSPCYSLIFPRYSKMGKFLNFDRFNIFKMLHSILFMVYSSFSLAITSLYFFRSKAENIVPNDPWFSYSFISNLVWFYSILNIKKFIFYIKIDLKFYFYDFW